MEDDSGEMAILISYKWVLCLRATHSSVLAWKIPCTEELGEHYSTWGRIESDTLAGNTFKGIKIVSRTERDTCTPMFITALFIIARTWKQPRCPFSR